MKKVFMAVLALSVMAMPSIAEARKGRKASAQRPAATAPAKQAAPQQQATSAAAPATTATNAAPQTGTGNSMMGNIMSTAAGVAIGSVVADSLTNNASAEEAPAVAPVTPETIEPAAQ